MKSDFSINVQVNVGVTPEVVALITAILARRPSQATAIETQEQRPQPQAETEAKESGGEAEAKPETPAKSEEPQPSPAPSDGEAKPKELTVADVREAMHKTRQRIEGEDYKEHTDSDLYKKYHRVLNGVFKQIAALLGSDLPSQLPAEQRQAFISECEQLKVLEDGTIGKDLPF